MGESGTRQARQAFRLVRQRRAGIADFRSRRANVCEQTDHSKQQREELSQIFQLLEAQLEARHAVLQGDLGLPSPYFRWLLSKLSSRQRQVLEAVVAGKANKVIAADLGISEKTVETHRARVMQKFHARSLAELVRLAISAGVLVSGS